MRRWLLLSALMAVTSHPAIAARAAPPVVYVPKLAAGPATAEAPAPDEATVTEAVRLLDADGFDENAMRSTELMIGVSLAAMVEALQRQFGDKAPQDLVEQVKTTIHDHAMATMRAHLAEMKRQTAMIYAQEFTKVELIRLRELHSDPVAVKARERSKDMEPKLIMIGVKTMRASQLELDAKIKKLVADYLASHGQSLPQNSSS